MKTIFEPKHMPFPWKHYEDGGRLDMPQSRSNGFAFGPQYADVVWGPRGAGWGVLADCSPMAPATAQTIANAKMIATIPDLVATCEFALTNLDKDHPLRAMAEIALRKAGRIA